MKPLLQSPTPSVTASSRVEQSPWETKSMTHTVDHLQCLFTPSHKQQTAAPLARGIYVFVRVKMIICEPACVCENNERQRDIVLVCTPQGH